MTARPQDVALLPCPFCGPNESVVSLYLDDVAMRYRVGCGRCGASTGTHPRDMTEAPAIAAWNTRANISAALASAQAREEELRAEVERLTRANGALTHLWESASGEFSRAEARAERLAEALRELVVEAEDVLQTHPQASTYPDGPCLEKACRHGLKITAQRARAALSTNAAQPGETT